MSETMTLDALKLVVAACRERITAVAERYVAEMVARNPRDHWGMRKWQHMLATAAGASHWGPEMAFTPAESVVLELGLLSHDLGRWVEALRGLATVRSGRQHGFLSAEVLVEERCLEGLPDRYRDAVLDAVRWHAELKVEAEPETLAFRMAMAIRDEDKVHIYDDRLYFEPGGIASEMVKHWLGPVELWLGIGGRKDEPWVLDLVTIEIAALQSGVALPLDIDPVRGAIQRFVRETWNRGVPQELVDLFCRRERIPKQLFLFSWAAYFGVYTLAFLFDVWSGAVRKRIVNHRHFVERVEFVCARESPENASRIRAAVAME